MNSRSRADSAAFCCSLCSFPTYLLTPLLLPALLSYACSEPKAAALPTIADRFVLFAFFILRLDVLLASS